MGRYGRCHGYGRRDDRTKRREFHLLLVFYVLSLTEPVLLKILHIINLYIQVVGDDCCWLFIRLCVCNVYKLYMLGE